MSHIAQGATSAILTHYQAVVEGSSSLNGVPGTQSADQLLRAGLTLTADTGGTTTSVVIASPSTAVAAHDWYRDVAPPFFLLALDGDNANAARKITAWSGTAFTVEKAFPAAPTAADTFTILEGFRRYGNDVDGDLVDDGVTGHDRFFQLSMLPGEPHGFYGSGLRTYSAALVLRLRLLTYGRLTDIRDAVVENLRILRDAIDRKENLETTYTRMLTSEGGSDRIVSESKDKVVGEVTFPILYRVGLGFE